jgi:hypothetical protein
MTNLGFWDAFESENPTASMYQFWVQKAAG